MSRLLRFLMCDSSIDIPNRLATNRAEGVLYLIAVFSALVIISAAGLAPIVVH